MRPRPRPRTERKRAEVKARIARHAAQRFAERGFDAVSIDDLAEAADVARGTLYTHFASKEAIVGELLGPMLAEATRRIDALGRAPAAKAFEGLLDVYLWLWEEHRDALRLAYRLQESAPLEQFDVDQGHRHFVAAVVRVFEKAARAHLLRAPNAMVAALSLSKVATPLLGLFAGVDPSGALFKASLRGLLLEDSAR